MPRHGIKWRMNPQTDKSSNKCNLHSEIVVNDDLWMYSHCVYKDTFATKTNHNTKATTPDRTERTYVQYQ